MSKIHQKTPSYNGCKSTLNHEGIEVVKETLNDQAKKPIETRVITRFLYLILTLNNFVFNGVNCLQKKGFARAQFAHLGMQTFSWENLKNYLFTPTLQIFHYFIVNL